MTPPVLLLIFNRPKLTRITFDRIRAARPSQLFIHADGPRPDRSDDKAACRETREIANNVDWPCDVHRLFRQENMGCGPAVQAALNWFFDHVEAGVVIEDDCAPLPGFFPFCTHMLERYRHTPEVMHISGMGFRHEVIPPGAAAFFSPIPFIWGWATWRRAWRLYTPSIPSSKETENVLARECPSRRARDYWREKFDATRSGEIRTWDYQWLHTLWSHAGSSVTPTFSLVENLGFGSEATHTKNAAIGYAEPSSQGLPNLDPVAVPCRSDIALAIHQCIFAHDQPARRLADMFRRPKWLWCLYLALHRRICGLPGGHRP
jgi:hypothetical protein